MPTGEAHQSPHGAGTAKARSPAWAIPPFEPGNGCAEAELAAINAAAITSSVMTIASVSDTCPDFPFLRIAPNATPPWPGQHTPIGGERKCYRRPDPRPRGKAPA